MLVFSAPARILYGSGDGLTRQTIDAFVRKYNAGRTVMEGGEHWFHTLAIGMYCENGRKQKVEQRRMSDLQGTAGVPDPG